MTPRFRRLVTLFVLFGMIAALLISSLSNLAG